MHLNVCKHCRKIFYHRMKAYTCEMCKGKDDQLFDQIKEYLVTYPNSNALQIAEGLDVEVYEVLQFMNEGRLTIVKGRWSKD